METNHKQANSVRCTGGDLQGDVTGLRGWIEDGNVINSAMRKRLFENVPSSLRSEEERVS